MNMLKIALILLVLVSFGYPALNITQMPNIDEITKQICLDNTTLYIERAETITAGINSELFNYTHNQTCAWGCSSNACNPAPFDNYLNMFKVFLLILAGLLGIFVIAKMRVF